MHERTSIVGDDEDSASCSESVFILIYSIAVFYFMSGHQVHNVYTQVVKLLVDQNGS